MMPACLAVALPQAAHPLATVNAVLNGLATVLLVAGWLAIRRGRVKAHRAAMTAAFVTSCVFLVSYLARYAIEGTHRFAGPDAMRPVYLAILGTHVPLAAAVPVLALRMFFLALRGRFDAHRRLGRITLPIWLYVSVTGVVIYLMLYVLFPPPRGAAVSACRTCSAPLASPPLADRGGPPAIIQA